jgi:hypothetical protein
LQTLPACDPEDQFGNTPGLVVGFSLHASVAAKAHERKKLERLCRYISHPAVTERRLSLTCSGKVRYELKTPIGLAPRIWFSSRWTSSPGSPPCPKPIVNLTRLHGVFVPNSKHRVLVTPARRGKGSKPQAANEAQEQTPAERRAAMTWAQRLKRVFSIDIEICGECGGGVKVISCIEDREVIKKILPPEGESRSGTSGPVAFSAGAPACQHATHRQVGRFDWLSKTDHSTQAATLQKQRDCMDAGGRATHGAVAEGIGLPYGRDCPESGGREGGFFGDGGVMPSRIRGDGRANGRPVLVDFEKKGVYFSYILPILFLFFLYFIITSEICLS